LVAKDKTQNPIHFLYIPKWLSSQKKERYISANWIPTEIVLMVDLVEEELFLIVLLQSKFSSDVTAKLKCSRWEEYEAHHQIVVADQRKLEPVSSIELPFLWRNWSPSGKIAMLVTMLDLLLTPEFS
jgi:hypothetical protein